jgi:hypothetical protein
MYCIYSLIRWCIFFGKFGHLYKRSLGNWDLGCTICLFYGDVLCLWCVWQYRYRIHVIGILLSASMYTSSPLSSLQFSKCLGYNSNESESSPMLSINYPLQATILTQGPIINIVWTGMYFMPCHWDFNHRYSLAFSKIQTLNIKRPSFNMHIWKDHRTCLSSE